MSAESFKKYDKAVQESIKKRLAEKNVNASGNLSKSLRSEISDINYRLFGANYSDFAEVGRGKNKNNSGGLLDAIYDWLQYKKYNISYKDDKERRSIAYAITKTIATKGSYKHRNPKKRTNVVEAAIEDNNTILLKGITKFVRSSQLKQLRNNLK